jgi:hypothetical protein
MAIKIFSGIQISFTRIPLQKKPSLQRTAFKVGKLLVTHLLWLPVQGWALPSAILQMFGRKCCSSERVYYGLEQVASSKWVMEEILKHASRKDTIIAIILLMNDLSMVAGK